MRILVLGAGLMARGAITDLLADNDVSQVSVVDRDSGALQALRSFLPDDSRLEWHEISLVDPESSNELRELMHHHDGVFSAMHYSLNVPLTRLAAATSTHMVDLGGNNDVVRAQLALDDQVQAAGVSVVPDCGLAPGLATMLTAWGLRHCPWADDVQIRVGGLPRDPQAPLMYERLFAVEGLINEYVETPIAIRNGEVVDLQPLGDVERVDFDQPIGELEAFNTSGGVSTLPESFAGRLHDLTYKTLRYPGHALAMRWMLELGLMSDEPATVNRIPVAPRQLLGSLIEKHVPLCSRDRALVRIDLSDSSAPDRRHQLQIVDEFDESTGLTAMMRTTAFPAAIILRMLCRGQAARPGVVPQELGIDPDAFVEQLVQRGIAIDGLDVPATSPVPSDR